MCREGLTRGIRWGKRSRATMACNVLYNLKRRMSELLEAAPVQVFDHSGDTCFTIVIVTNIPCCPSLDHLYFIFLLFYVRVPYGSGVF